MTGQASTPAPKWYPWLIAASAGAGLLALRLFETPFRFLTPPCALHALTGFHCPGCGITRATRALLHGDVAAAWNYNQLYLILLPLVGIFCLQSMVLERPYRGSAKLGSAILVVAVLYGVLRNIPVAPFTALAPH
jgi:hypothetical protein